MVKKSLAAAELLAKQGISAEVIDPRTLAPLDVKTIVESVKKTGRLVLVDQAPRHASAAVVIAGEVAEHGFKYLKAPVKMVTALDTSVPYSEPMESYVLPSEDKIVQAVKSVLAVQSCGGVAVREVTMRRASSSCDSRVQCGAVSGKPRANGFPGTIFVRPNRRANKAAAKSTTHCSRLMRIYLKLLGTPAVPTNSSLLTSPEYIQQRDWDFPSKVTPWSAAAQAGGNRASP